MKLALATIRDRAASASAGLSGKAGNTEQKCPDVTLEIGVFFDGTLNNMANAQTGGGEGSYGNAMSNVALLWQLYKQGSSYDVTNSCGGYARRFAALYKDGPGSTAGKDDDIPGKALGLGATGIESRVYEACIEVGQIIKRLSPGVEPTEVILDVFGFSRGAAAARYFVNCFRQGFIEYDAYFVNRKRAYLPKGRKVRIRFLGIFDTVAAVGLGTNDDNGPVNVHLSAAQADEIHHLTAEDEYRENFRLNHNLPGGGGARSLPGAHSDIGGGYRGTLDKVVTRQWTETHASWQQAEAARTQVLAANSTQTGTGMDVWRTEGWVSGSEKQPALRNDPGPVTPVYGMMGVPMLYQFSVTQTLTRIVALGLSRIALRIMYDRALAGKVPMLGFPTGSDYALPAGLADLGGRIIAGHTPTTAEHKTLLSGYGHVSAKADAIGMAAEPGHKRTVYPNQPDKAR